MSKQSIWSHLSNTFEDEEENLIYIDAWLTPDDNENGVVIATINKDTRKVEYRDNRAMTDSYAQDMINEIIMDLNN